MKRLLIAIAMIASNAHAQKYYPTTFPDMPPVISYEQMMYLPPAKRIEYIKDLRGVLLALEQDMNRGSRKNAGLEEYREQLNALILQLGVPSAYADEPDCPAGYTYIAVFGRCTRVARESGCAPVEDSISRNGATYCHPNPQKAYIFQQRSQLSGQGLPRSVTPVNPSPAGANPPANPAGAPAIDPPANPAAAPAGTVAPAMPPAQRRDYSGPADGTVNLPGTCVKREKTKDFHTETTNFLRDTNVGEGSRNCLIGGMFSNYVNNEIKASNCQKIQTFPPDSAAQGADVLKCTGNKSMCNPLLYCGPKKGEAYCLPTTQNLTKACEAKAKGDCDPFNGEHGWAGAQAEWTAFKKNMDALCKGGRAGAKFNQYFCEECKLLVERMKKIEPKYAPYKKNMPATTPPATPPPAAPAAGVRDV